MNTAQTTVQPVTTRAAALAAGDLIDVSEVAAKMGFRQPVAVTRAVWEDSIWWDETIEAGKTGCSGDDTDARLHDVVWMARTATMADPRASYALFTLRRIPTTGKGSQTKPVTLAVTCGPGDRSEPVVTIMFPDED